MATFEAAQNNNDAGSGFADLASGSLPTLGGGDPLLPSWSRSLSELQVASQSLLGGGRPSAGNAASLLGTDRSEFGRLASTLVADTTTSTGTRSQANNFTSASHHQLPEESFTTVAELLQKQQTDILENLLESARESARAKSQAYVDQQLKDDWEREKQWWIQDIVGTRTLGGASSSLALASSSNDMMPKALTAPYPTSTPRFLGDTTSSSRSSSSQLDAKSVQAHFQVLQKVAATNNPSGVQAARDMLAKLQALTDASSVPEDSFYHTALDFVACLLERNANGSPMDHSMGVLVHLSRQFQSMIVQRVRAASLAGQDVSTGGAYNSGMVSTIAAHVQLEFGAEKSIWHMLYFCLRCGDAVAAKAALDVAFANHEATDMHESVRHVIYRLCQRQGGASCVWEMGPPVLSGQDRQILGDLYDQAVQAAATSSEHDAIYRRGTLALLSGIRDLPSDGSAIGFSTIEDYMYGNLWQAVQDPNPMEQINKLGDLIRNYGPEYFCDDDSSGWSYTLPLMAAQQFQTALSYLGEAGGATGLIQATHLALVMSVAGINVVDVGRSPSSECIVSALLVAYASKLQTEPSAGVMVSLEYLLWIPNADRKRRELAALIVHSQGSETLVGVLSRDGVRQNSALDNMLSSRQEVSLVIAQAAELLQKDMMDKARGETAARLYMLAGKYSSVVSLLNELMSPPNHLDDIKNFWCKQSEMFYDTYLAKASLIRQSMQQENKLDLIDTNNLLRQLRSFFEKLRAGDIDEALSTVTRMDVLPFSKGEMTAKTQKYQGLDKLVKEAFPSLLQGTMECLYNQHRQIKADSRANTPTVQARLKELQEMARLLHTFAGLANVPSSLKDSLSRLEAHMI